MTASGEAFLAKASESLAGASSELASGRYNNAANRAYYACFQAAIAALDVAGIRPPGRTEQWSHAFVQAQFNGVLIGRRKRYPAALRDVLPEQFTIRQQADYSRAKVSRRGAAEAVSRAEHFVQTIVAHADDGGRQ